MKALITGITGQDGSYLAEYLLSLGYEVHGLIRRLSIEDDQNKMYRIKSFKNKLFLHVCSLENYSFLYELFSKILPNECYHLAAQSFVSHDFHEEFSTMNVNINGTHNILSCIKSVNPSCKFYFAGSSEIFGNINESPQNENTKFRPRSIYGISKMAGFELTRNYREKYNLFACSGILYNHESPRRGFEFVTRKISSVAAKIKLGIENKIHLGNINSKRDWGYAGDYVKAMHLMLNQDIPEDFVIGTSKIHSVKDFLKAAFGELDLKYEDYLVIDKNYFRSEEGNILVADSRYSKKKLGWEPTLDFKNLVKIMVKSDYNLFKTKLNK